MARHFIMFLSLKTGALVMAFINFLGGLGEIIGGLVKITEAKQNENITVFIVCVLLGIITLLSGTLLTIGIINGKEGYILLYILIGSTVLLIVTIYSGINMFEYGWLMLIFFISLFLWYGQYCMYNFYEELLSFNKVESGTSQIVYNIDGYTNEAVVNDNTQV